MIAFVTLLLGLISGTYPIEVTVSGPVAAVEFQLDGAEAGRIEGPPWVARVDLGKDLRPRELVARALGADGREIGRTSQWLNLPRRPAEVEIVLESGEDGVPKAAVLTWQSVNGVRPSSIGLTLDGQPLIVGKDGRAALPPRDLKTLHVLTAQLWFPPGVPARKDVVFGGEYGSQVSTELTAVPVRVHPGAALPPPEDLQGWFAAGGQPVPVAAVEDGPGKVILVRVPSASEVTRKLVPLSQRWGTEKLRREMRLGPDDRVRYLSLASSRYRNSRVPAELFDITRDLAPKDGGMLWFLTSSRLLKESRGKGRRIADAVAVAALAAENYRRAVVLVVGRELDETSRYDPATVRRYLQSMRVPLFVWGLYGPDTPAARAWGGAEDVSSLAKLQQAVAKLRAELDAQKIVWVEGRHLPQEVSLTPAARGVELPGVR
ncbi:MAG TPA: hypothetical protein VGG03_27715 [Thermoanaerobaculia bacterium]|jgi:hypothetical protein